MTERKSFDAVGFRARIVYEGLAKTLIYGYMA